MRAGCGDAGRVWGCRQGAGRAGGCDPSFFSPMEDASLQTGLHGGALQKSTQAGAQAAGACRQGSGRGQTTQASSAGREEKDRPASQGA